MRPMFVFGDFMRGEPNNDLLDGARFLGEATIPAKYQTVLVERDHGMPALVIAETVGMTGQAVTGELYEINEEHRDRLKSRLGNSRVTGVTVEAAGEHIKAQALVGSFPIEAPILIENYREHRLVLETAGLHMYSRYTRNQGASNPQTQIASQKGKKSWLASTEKTPEQVADDFVGHAMTIMGKDAAGWESVHPAAATYISKLNRRMNGDHDGSAPQPDLMDSLEELKTSLGDTDGRKVVLIMRKLTSPSDGQLEEVDSDDPDAEPVVPV